MQGPGLRAGVDTESMNVPAVAKAQAFTRVEIDSEIPRQALDAAPVIFTAGEYPHGGQGQSLLQGQGIGNQLCHVEINVAGVQGAGEPV